MNILYIEDEIGIATPVIKFLSRNGFAITHAVDGAEGLSKFFKDKFDLILLDLNLPTIDGIQVAKRIRERNLHIPIVMLTARGLLNNKLEGFDTGADDYLTKPFELSELLARINARVKNIKVSPEGYAIGELQFYPQKNLVKSSTENIELSLKECDLLALLLKYRGQIVSVDEILKVVWQTNANLITDTVKTHIKTLRHKLGADGDKVKTVRGRGYFIEN